MVPRLSDLPAPGPVPVALFVLAATGAFAWLSATGQIELVSLAALQLIGMLLFISWVGVFRPLRDVLPGEQYE
ncbi:hypothetical protein BV210_07110 [Halorientalis sp. IM1011]|uniref:hypothetical protein n=1 Tax=Halorientalis sp. IM1011 TaxID=1932360 RepID=UPI00097CD3FB|nr:hypothetical protein [Halorientalis sp. IM1011]AQL42494.1 hypothetical protein BV210_07110 [Halorientalis sp. IM1011]